MEITTEEHVSSLAEALGEAPIVKVALNALIPGDSPRQVQQDIGHVQVLADAGDELPPIVVHRDTMRIIDGVHRVHACRTRGQRDIAVRFFDGSGEDAFLLAVKLNVKHGMPLSLAERRAAAERIVMSHPSWSDRSIANVSGLSPKTVAAIRSRSTELVPRSNVRIGSDGRVRPLSAVSGRLKASRMIAERPDATLRKVAAECGISIGTAHDVRRRMANGLDPVPTGHRGGGQGHTEATPTEVPSSSAESIRTRFQRLSREPGLKYSPQGRRMLQLLRLSMIVEDERQTVLGAVPPYWMDTLAELARFCASQWQLVADEAEQRGRDSA